MSIRMAFNGGIVAICIAAAAQGELVNGSNTLDISEFQFSSDSVTFPGFQDPDTCLAGTTTLQSVDINWSVRGTSDNASGPSSSTHSVEVAFYFNDLSGAVGFVATGTTEGSTGTNSSHSHDFLATITGTFSGSQAANYEQNSVTLQADFQNALLAGSAGHSHNIVTMQVTPSVTYNYQCSAIPEPSSFLFLGTVVLLGSCVKRVVKRA